MCRGMSVAQKN